jgi:hypothetical protein
MSTRKRKTADLTGIRQRGARFQVRIFGGIDPATGRQLILTVDPLPARRGRDLAVPPGRAPLTVRSRVEDADLAWLVR